MIARVRGRVVTVEPRCIVDVGGVGFELAIPEKDREALSPVDGETVFHTHLVVREDSMSLFGFLHREDRDLFLKLISVSGVGPKIGLAALAQYPAARVASAIRGGDSTFLSRIQGIGKKTAERIVIDLGNKVDEFVSAAEPVVTGSKVRDEVLLALTSLGMTHSAAEGVLDRMEWDDKDSAEELVRRALKYAGGA
ncbi:MAG TPA: Holliday junction branch migration protein RuvA [Candidatus Krumholzibacteria bacterium]